MSRPSSGREAGPLGGRTHDFDLHGIVGVRLMDATEDDVATVRRQLGPIDAALDREPDLTIRFVDVLRGGPLTFVGVGDSGFDDDTFYLLRGRGGAGGRSAMPLDLVGRGLEIVCERGLPAVPHLLALLNLTALAKGVLPLHATAFTSGTTGVLVTGWSKGGKTEALLGCMGDGADYVGDEWVYLTDDGRMLGLPEPIRVWDWQFGQLPALLRARPAPERRRLAAWRTLAGLADAAAHSRLLDASLVRRAAPILRRQAYLQVAPADLFGAENVSLQGRLDVVVLVLSHEENTIVSRPADPGEVAHRMKASLEEERSALMTHYRHFRYAFPDRANPVIDNAAELESKLLTALLDDRPCIKVLHPHPCDLRLLGRTVLRAASTARDEALAAGARFDEQPPPS